MATVRPRRDLALTFNMAAEKVTKGGSQRRHGALAVLFDVRGMAILQQDFLSCIILFL